MTRTVPVTVVVPAYNASPYLKVTLEALQSQTKVPEQIVVIDDGSTDDTAQIAEGFGVELIRQVQRGPGAVS